MSGAEIALVASAVIGAGSAVYQTKEAKKNRPKAIGKDKEQLQAEQDVREDKFDSENVNKNRGAAVEASMTRKSLLGNLGGNSSKLGLNTTFGSAARGKNSGGI
tara:strand:- start:134 stop:445 length:312 start_codon:yes stop_codon:yes gene_type:complete